MSLAETAPANDLAACPFCASPMVHYQNKLWDDSDVTLHMVVCRCGASSGMFDAQEAAREAWNCRAGETSESLNTYAWLRLILLAISVGTITILAAIILLALLK